MPKRIIIYKCRLGGEREERPVEVATWGELSTRLREAAAGSPVFGEHSIEETVVHICATREHQHGLADLVGIAELEDTTE